jgi:uncharacterized membrane protein
MANSEKINEQLENIYINLATLQGSQMNAMTKQTNVKNLIDTENSRLTQKKNTIDQAIDNQKRIIYFNDNSRKINLAYLSILITIAISLAMVYLVRIIFYHFGDSITQYVGNFFSDIIFNILMIAIISIGILISAMNYKTIIYRDPYNFDELRLSAPKMADSTENKGGNLGLNPSGAGCIGPQCCTPSTPQTPGTQWSEIQGKCVYSPVAPATTIPTTAPTIQPAVPPFSPEPFYSPTQ